jgi:TatD DNase family protein
VIFTDSHCHLTMSDAAASLAAARAAGVRGFVVPGTNAGDAPAAVALAEQNADVWAAVGFHPHDAKDCDEARFAEIERLSTAPRVVAIGEAGLDYHYMHSPREVQRDVLVRHLALARERSVPVIIHNRESTQDLIDLLESTEAKGTRGVLHSFTESLDVARRLIGLGYFISFSGIVTFRTAAGLREVARSIPLDRMLIETDTPYLAPVPHRGKENQPAYVVRVAELIADLRGIALQEVAEQTTANFELLFGVKVASGTA